MKYKLRQKYKKIGLSPYQTVAGLRNIKEIATKVSGDEYIAREIRSITILPLDEQEERWFGENDKRKELTCQAQLCALCQDLSAFIELVLRHAGLDSFSWPSNSLEDLDYTRPESFWQALSKTALSLLELDLGFFPNEIHNMAFMNPFPEPFRYLCSLTLGMKGAQGDNAFMIDRLLQSIHLLEFLSLDLPLGNVYHQRVHGLTYNYSLPKLQTFELSGYLDETVGLMLFLNNHPSITSLSLHVDGDQPLRIYPTWLPKLESLSLGSAGPDPDLLQFDLLHPSYNRPITHLHIRRPLGAPDVLLGVFQHRLRCLELDITSWREERVEYALRELLPYLPELIELDVMFSSKNIVYRNDNDQWRNADALDVDDMCRLLSILPSNSPIRVVKMADANGMQLPSSFLNNIPPVPEMLAFIGWTYNGHELSYRLQHQDSGVIKAVKFTPKRHPCGRPWGTLE